jgi:uncharacterized protein (TIGR02996 family)
MDQETGFLRALREDPNDTVTRQVYADWLAERGDPPSLARSDFLRLDLELVAMKTDDPRRAGLTPRLLQLRETIDLPWLAAVERLPVENCLVQFEFECPKRWEKMQATEEPRVRFCETCEKKVYHCATSTELRIHAIQGHCVAVDLRVPRSDGDLDSFMHMMAGRIAIPPAPPEWVDRLNPGQRLRVRDGTFAGMEGWITSWNRQRQTVSISLAIFGRPTPVELELWQVEPID